MVARLLRRLVGLARTANRAVVLTFLVAAAASLLNWSLGRVVAAILAREAARRARVDFGWLVAAAYSGFVVRASGTSSIALTQATHGDALNILEKLTGQLLPLSDTVFATFNWLPTLLIVLAMPVVYRRLRHPPGRRRRDALRAGAGSATPGSGPVELHRPAHGPLAGRQPIPAGGGAGRRGGAVGTGHAHLRR